MPHSGGRDVLLLGSVGLANAEDVFRMAAAMLGERAPRIPDGETGYGDFEPRHGVQQKDLQTCVDMANDGRAPCQR